MRIEDLASDPVLLLVWIMAYRYRNKQYRFLVNGQTGKPIGQAPISYVRFMILVSLTVAALMFVLGLLVLMG